MLAGVSTCRRKYFAKVAKLKPSTREPRGLVHNRPTLYIVAGVDLLYVQWAYQWCVRAEFIVISVRSSGKANFAT